MSKIYFWVCEPIKYEPPNFFTKEVGKPTQITQRDDETQSEDENQATDETQTIHVDATNNGYDQKRSSKRKLVKGETES